MGSYRTLRILLSVASAAAFLAAIWLVGAALTGALDAQVFDPITGTPRTVSFGYIGLQWAAGCVASALVFAALAAIIRLLGELRLQTRVEMVTNPSEPVLPLMVRKN